MGSIGMEKKAAMRRHVLILTGTPGVGKHTVADQIARMSDGWHIIDVNEAARNAGLYDCKKGDIHDAAGNNADYNQQRTNDEKTKQDTADSLGRTASSNSSNTMPPVDIDTHKLATIVEKLLGSPGNHIVVGHLAPYVTSRDSVMFAVILRRNPYQLAKVYKKRGYPQEKILENAGSEVLGTIAYDTFCASYVKTGQFDTTDKQAKKVAAEILDALRVMYHGDYNSEPGDTQGTDGMPWEPVDWLHKPDCTTKDHSIRNQDAERHNNTVENQSSLKMLQDFVSGWPRTKH